MLGASPGRVWREVDLPMLWRAALVGAVFAFTISLGEFGATSFSGAPGMPTLPVAISRFLSQPGALELRAGHGHGDAADAGVRARACCVERCQESAAEETSLCLKCENIHKITKSKPLLRGVSFTVAAGETVCLLGPSGSGKSTLLRIIAGLEAAEGGQVLWDGQDLAPAGAPAQFWPDVPGLRPFPHRSVAENMAFGLRMQNLPRAEIDAAVSAERWNRCNGRSSPDRRVTDLSGGEQQRVALARALAPRPRLLMLDEPLGALDRPARAAHGRTAPPAAAAGIPAIYVTHDQEEAFTLADRLVVLHEGRIEQEGPPEQVVSCPATPWTARFLGLSNLLPASILSLQPLIVHSALGDWQLPAGGEACSRPWKSGDPASLLLRPNGASLQEVTGAFLLHGRVEQVLFRGDHHRVELLAEQGCRLQFDLDQPLPEGAQACLWLRPDSLRCLPPEESAP